MFAKLFILAIAVAAVASRPAISAVTSYSAPVVSAVGPSVFATRSIPYSAVATPVAYSNVVSPAGVTAYSSPITPYSYGSPVAYSAGVPVTYSAGVPVTYSNWNGVAPYTIY
ncbi:pupal cuticle protein C1B-like [Topomyia yanbarensis]|uniref:pupal cuticle protein C1B-like n=1 Tax=Topomyia yanbarensis TaxID=2498891 RepID=UPI00273C4A81|nr:pupal cuticle protein C1B-like [Topomyia yanbarensis]